MSNEPKHEAVKSRNEPFAEKTATKICCEIPAADNPYIAQTVLCHGYDMFELMAKRSYVEVLFLLFRGELPDAAQAQLLQQLMIGLMNPGPRHAATRAAMNTGIGKTDPLHILPIASAVYAGEYSGAKEVENAMQFFAQHAGRDPAEVVAEFAAAAPPAIDIAGFGVRHGGIELIAVQLAGRLAGLSDAHKTLHWGQTLADELGATGNGWLTTGVAAAALTDLGFQPRAGACLFQLFGAPGLLAHGLEMAGKPILAMPFVSDENYIIETKPDAE
jgi:citrate synthase